MPRDEKDSYIIEHANSMSCGEMAQRLGVHKSTVSRRLSSLRASGELPDTSARIDAEHRTSQARERLRAAALSRADRIEALAELRDMLHADLAISGGASLARVSSEYRQCLEQLEQLSEEVHAIEAAGARRVGAVHMARMKMSLFEEFQDVERGTVAGIVDAVIRYLASIDVIQAPTPLDEIMSTADASADE